LSHTFRESLYLIIDHSEVLQSFTGWKLCHMTWEGSLAIYSHVKCTSDIFNGTGRKSNVQIKIQELTGDEGLISSSLHQQSALSMQSW